MYTLGLCFVCQPFSETKHRQISCRLQLKIARGPTLCMERNDALYSGLRSLKMLGSILGLLVGMSLSIVSHEIWWIHEGRFVSKIWQLGLRFHSSIENRIPSRVSVQDPESCTIKGQMCGLFSDPSLRSSYMRLCIHIFGRRFIIAFVATFTRPLPPLNKIPFQYDSDLLDA